MSIVHWSTPRKITQEWKQVHAEDIAMRGMPLCCYCGKPVGLGSFADHLYPYYDDTSYHICHYKQDKIARRIIDKL